MPSRRSLKTRQISATVLAAGALLVIPSTTVLAATGPAKTTCRDANSKVTGATVTAHICWKGSKVWASGMIYDTKADKRKACVRVQYVQKYVRKGKDCMINSAPGKKQAWKYTLTGAKKFYFKACAENAAKALCDDKWR